MDSQERNKVMDGYFNGPGASTAKEIGETIQAIRECYELARAWDRVMKHGTTDDPACSPGTWEDVHRYMEWAQLLFTTPKDPMEELEKP